MLTIRLYSVASVIDANSKNVYAMYQDGRYDEDSATHFDDMPEEWIKSLDKYDRQLIERYLNIQL